MEALFLRVLSLSLACSAVILPLLFLGRVLRSRYAARTLYFLWLLLAVRLLVPIRLELPTPTVAVEVPAYTLSIPAYQPAKSASANPTQPKTDAVRPAEAAPQRRTVSMTALGASLWGIGAAGVLLWQCLVYLLARKKLLCRAKPVELALPPKVRAVWSPEAETPMMLGVVRPLLVLPDRVVDGDALDVVLRHELCHLRRRDVIYKTLMLLVSAVYWFNPVVWLMAREAGRNVELCCDDEVLKDADRAERRRYGEVLLAASAGGRTLAFATQFGSPKNQMKERLGNLFAQKKTGVVLVCVLLAAALIVGSGVVLRQGEDDTLYRNDQYGFTLQLPQSWRGKYTTQESTSVTTGQTPKHFIVFLQNSSRGGPPGIFALNIDDADEKITEEPGHVILLGEGGGKVFSLMFYDESVENDDTFFALRGDALKLTAADFRYFGLADEGTKPPESSPSPAAPVETPAPVEATATETGLEYVLGNGSYAIKVPLDWAGKFDMEEIEVIQAVLFTKKSSEESLFCIQAASTEEWIQFQAEDRKPVEPLVVLGTQGDRTYIFGFLRLRETDSQEYRDMKRSLMSVVEQFTFLNGGTRDISVVLPEFDPGTGWQWPVDGCYSISTTFGARIHPITGKAGNHPGTDIAAPKDTVVQAARGGVVIDCGYDEGDGNYVKVDHGDGYATRYCHLSTLAVDVGQIVEQGQTVGYVGMTGSATGYHLHYELWYNGARSDVLDKYSNLKFSYQ